MTAVAGHTVTGPADRQPSSPAWPPRRPGAGRRLENPFDSSSSSSSVKTPRQRGGEANRALEAVIAHNEAQTTREAKWTLTESALARLTGCFRPAIRTFFAQHAQEIEAHNLQHHLLPGLNAARGRRNQQIENEVQWREDEADTAGKKAPEGTTEPAEENEQTADDHVQKG